MIREAGIDKNSKVIDFGCGYGKPLLDVCKATGCEGVGIDLSAENVKICKQIQKEDYKADIKTSFQIGSFTP
eukprot:UN17047